VPTSLVESGTSGCLLLAQLVFLAEKAYLRSDGSKRVEQQVGFDGSILAMRALVNEGPPDANSRDAPNGEYDRPFSATGA
jgi:hypothetical protein